MLFFTDPSHQDQVSFVVNAPFPDMLGWLSRSGIGLSTMVDEHFGINVVEFMVSGAILSFISRSIACSARVFTVIRLRVSFPSPMPLEVR